MGQLRFILILLFQLNLQQFSLTSAEDLNVVLCNARLPTGRSHMTAAYDGDDTVYLFGGYDTYYLKSILSYSISQDKVQYLGELSGYSFSGGGAQDRNKNIFHIQGFAGQDIYKYVPDKNSQSTVATLPRSNYRFATAQPDPDNVLIMGGAEDKETVLRMNLNTSQLEKVATLPIPLESPAAIYYEKKDAVYIFSSDLNPPKLIKYFPASNKFEVLSNTNLPYVYNGIDVVWDGQHSQAYIVGGVMLKTNNRRIVRFDPESETFHNIAVGGAPGFAGNDIFRTASVYVKKLNRIYIFGGYTYKDADIDEIYYINL